MKIYIAGRIAGDRKYRAKFREAAKALEGMGHVVLNPATLPDGQICRVQHGHADLHIVRVCQAVRQSGRVPAGLPGEPRRHGGMGVLPEDRERLRPIHGHDRRRQTVSKAQISMWEEKIVDSFAGGGGASTGIELATGRVVDIAINHDPDAILMHKTNHPARGQRVGCGPARSHRRQPGGPVVGLP